MPRHSTMLPSSVGNLVSLANRPVLFIGCSLDGLLADLGAAGIPEDSASKHFAVAGVAGNSWRQDAPSCRIATELPVFLDKLVQRSRAVLQIPATQRRLGRRRLGE
ncbi:MAG: hypothetical protein ACRD30_08185 [Bryobacteraceae bacterium]